MCLNDIVSQHEMLKQHLLEQLKNDKSLIMTLAEDMVECATNIQGHGYPAFIQSRNRFLGVLDELVENYSSLIKYHV